MRATRQWNGHSTTILMFPQPIISVSSQSTLKFDVLGWTELPQMLIWGFHKSNFCRLTLVGQQMADLPLDPRLGKALVASISLGCSEEVSVILAVLSVQRIWFTGQGVKALDIAKQKWVACSIPDLPIETSDNSSMLNVPSATESGARGELKEWAQLIEVWQF